MLTIKIPDYEASPRQTKFHISPAYETLYGGAAGGGKTAALSAEAITSALEMEGTAVYIFRRTLKELKQSIYQEINKQIAPYQAVPDARKQIKITYNGADSRFSFSNGSYIQLAYLDTVADRYRYQSAEIHELLIDELSHFLKDDYDYLKTRVRSSTPRRLRVMAATNPGGVGHGWVKDYFIVRHSPETVYRVEDGGFTRQFIPAKVDDHPVAAFRESYKRTLQSIEDPQLREALLDGSWDAFQGQVFNEWAPSRHVLTREQFLDEVNLLECQKFVGFDWGWRDPAVAAWIALAPKDPETGVQHCYLYREIHQNETTAEDWAKMLKEIIDSEPVTWIAMPHDTYQHHLGDKTIASIFTNIGLPVRPIQSLLKGARKNRQALMHQMLSDSPDGLPYFGAHEQCTNFIRTLPSLSYSDTIPEEIDSKADDHDYDATSYALSLMRQTGAYVVTPKAMRDPSKESFIINPETKVAEGLHYDPGKALKVSANKNNRDWRYR